MWTTIRSMFIGPPLPTHELAETRLDKIRALAAFSPDALSSIAYANQEIYLGLLVAGSAGLDLTLPIGTAITLLLVLVSASYFQTIHAYPSGGGSYAVAVRNLGTLPGLAAAAALLVDYVLTAAVSLTAAVAAIASAFPELWAHRVILALALLCLVTLANLRGLRETGTLMALPVYLFVSTYMAMLLYGWVRFVLEGPGTAAWVVPTAVQPPTWPLILHTFASGCTALTGIEAISNGVPVFRPPESKNAGQTLLVMALLMGLLFTGSVGLTQVRHVVAGPEETILSALSRGVLGPGMSYLLVQAATMLILTVAANTSFAGFPRLTAILAQERFLPRQLTSLGERLVLSRGILLLAGATGVLIVIFNGDSHALVPLFAVGVFLAFTLSQAGMVVHWQRVRADRWRLKALLNGVGAVMTGATLLVIGVSKFTEGAWITLVLIPTLVALFFRIQGHYRRVSQQLTLDGLAPQTRQWPAPRIVIPVSGVHRATLDAVACARAISSDVTAVYIELEPGTAEGIRAAWGEWCPDVPLVIIPSPYRTIIKPLLDYLDETDQQHNDGQLATVVLPEFVPAKWWHSLLHNQTAWLIKAALLYRRRRLGFQRTIIDVPYHLQH